MTLRATTSQTVGPFFSIGMERLNCAELAGPGVAGERVTIEGRATQWTRRGDSGQSATFQFCPVCGSIVYWEATGVPGFVVVAVGMFADPSFPPPHVSVYEERQHKWALAAGQLPLEHEF